MVLDPEQSPITEVSLGDYFRRRLARLAAGMRPPPQEDTCFYLSRLLARFSRSEWLFSYQAGETGVRPLALLYGEARDAGWERDRCRLLQQLGDMALFLGALFPLRWARQGIQRDYFVGMGSGAYEYLADHARDDRHVYAELAGTFSGLLDLLTDACAGGRGPDAESVLALYRQWALTGDPAVAARLQAMGILVNPQAISH